MYILKDKVLIGEKIKKYRKLKKMTQFELAEKIGLNVKQISRIEAGLNYPTYLTFVNILETLDINLDEFLINEKPAENPEAADVIKIIKNADGMELKMYMDVIKSMKKNLKRIF